MIFHEILMVSSDCKGKVHRYMQYVVANLSGGINIALVTYERSRGMKGE